MIGNVYERLTVIREGKVTTTPKGARLPYFWCKCVCGNEVEVLKYNLTSKVLKVRSCGCLRKEMCSIIRTNTVVRESNVDYLLLNDGIKIAIDLDKKKLDKFYWVYGEDNNSVSARRNEKKVYLHTLVVGGTRKGYRIYQKVKGYDYRKSNFMYRRLGSPHVTLQLRNDNWAEVMLESSEGKAQRLSKERGDMVASARESYKLRRFEEMKDKAGREGDILLASEYTGVQDKLPFTCKEGHSFSGSYESYITVGSGCIHCGYVVSGLRSRTSLEELQSRASKKGGRLVSKETLAAGLKYTWECSKGHEFDSSSGNVQNGYWCPVCKESWSEKKVRYMLETCTGKKFPSSHPKFLSGCNGNANSNLELDGYNKDLKIAFEHQGLQHYEFCNFFRTEDKFEAQQMRDSWKAAKCKEEGVLLICVPQLGKLTPENSLWTLLRDRIRSFNPDITFASTHVDLDDVYIV